MVGIERKKLFPKKGSVGRCPKCSSTRTTAVFMPRTNFYATNIVKCVNCKALWEPINEEQLWDEDDDLCSFKEPCDNCAFRPGAPEQQDKKRWRELVDGLKSGAMFYCHKGVPINPQAKDGFDYPYRDGKPVRNKLRLCRGFLNASNSWYKNNEGANQ